METKINMPAKRAKLSLNFLLRARNMVAGSEKNHNKTKFFFLINWGKIYDFFKFCIEKSESDTVSLNLIRIFFKETETLLQVLRKKHDKKNLDREIRTWYSLQCTINKKKYVQMSNCILLQNRGKWNITKYSHLSQTNIKRSKTQQFIFGKKN